MLYAIGVGVGGVAEATLLLLLGAVVEVVDE